MIPESSVAARRRSRAAFVLHAIVHAALAGFVWFGAWSADRTFVQPDHSPVFPIDKASRFLRETLAGGAFTPLDLHWFLGDPYRWATLEYAIPCYLAGLALAWMLRGRGLSLLASYGAALAFSFAGYSTTLFSAGHLGWFEFIAFGVFVFGLVDRTVRGGSFRHAALLGGALAWGAARQSDMWMLFTAFAGAYGLWCVVREARLSAPGAGLRAPRAVGRLAAALALAGAVAIAAGLPQFRHALGEDLAVRDRQIAASAGGAADSEARWEFATNWSMPPEDMLEFAACEVRGGSSDPRVSPKLPYRGRLGRPIESKFVAGRTMPNYRQHSLYLGAITVVFALVAAAALFRRRDDDARFVDIPFWCAAAALCAILSMGRYTPVYRLFHALPFMDYLRAPVKFHHLVELSVTVLAGYGIELVSSRSLVGRVRSASLALPAALAAFLGAAAIGFAAGRASIAEGIAALGFDAARASALAGAAVSGTVRGCALAVFAAAVAWFAGRGRTGAKSAFAALALAALVNAVDLAQVDHRYLAPVDLSFRLAANPIAADAIAAGGGGIAAPIPGFGALGESLIANGVEAVTEDPADPLVRFAVLPAGAEKADTALGALVAKRRGRPIGFYTVERRGFARARPGTNAQLALFRFEDASAPVASKPVSIASIVSVTTTAALLGLAAFPWIAGLLRRKRGSGEVSSK